MKTFKQFLKESANIKDLQQLAFDLTSGNGYIEKACQFFEIEESWDNLFNKVFSLKDKNKLYEYIKYVRNVDIRHMNYNQLKDLLYSLCFHDEWIVKIADIMINNNIGNIDKNWTESYILMYFEGKPNNKELDLIWKKLNLV